jgi:hypothetical protein
MTENAEWPDEEVPLDEEAYPPPEEGIEDKLPGDIPEIPEVSDIPPTPDGS